MLTITNVKGHRVACVFPCVNGSGTVVDSAVVTTDDEYPRATYLVWRVKVTADGQETHLLDTLSTFPAAIRSARKTQGWG